MKKSTMFLFYLGLALAMPLGAQADEVRYTTHIKQIVDARCSMCHGSDSPEYQEYKANKKSYQEQAKGPRMDSYTYLISFIGWPDNGAIMRRLDDGNNTKDGKPGNMYQYLGNTEENRQKNLALFKEWIGNWNLKRWPEINKEDLNGLKLKY